jgi:hypothetical protein
VLWGCVVGLCCGVVLWGCVVGLCCGVVLWGCVVGLCCGVVLGGCVVGLCCVVLCCVVGLCCGVVLWGCVVGLNSFVLYYVVLFCFLYYKEFILILFSQFSLQIRDVLSGSLPVELSTLPDYSVMAKGSMDQNATKG